MENETSYSGGIDWGRDLEKFPEKYLRSPQARSDELLDLQQKIQNAIKRREFLISPRGYETIVDSSLRRIEEIKKEIAEFLDARKLYCGQIEELKRRETLLNEIIASRSKSRRAQASGSAKEIDGETLKNIQSTLGIPMHVITTSPRSQVLKWARIAEGVEV